MLIRLLGDSATAPTHLVPSQHVSAFSEESPEPSEFVIRCPQTPSTYVRFCDWSRLDEYVVAFTVEGVAAGMRARLDSVRISYWDGAGPLDAFLATLARDFRGWEGERTWVTNQLVVTATFRSGGHVRLCWTLRPDFSVDDSWECSVTTTVEAGEQLSWLADEMQGFLQQGQAAPLGS
ncbi:permease [Streptomyces griseocarneus]|nr:permease [Streptomyces griseocarneus]